MGYIQKMSEKRNLKKRERYVKNKLAKINHFSEKYGVKKFYEYRFGTSDLKDLYLDLLKKSILNDEVSMLGEHKLDTLRYCTEDCLKNNIQGDIIETGVWKGGATIYLAGILKAHGNTDKKVFVADSFEGLPPPDATKWPQDKGDTSYKRTDLAISVQDVKDNFRKFNLLSENIIFIKGFFEHSLQSADIQKLAILRLDGDMYGSTMTVLEQLYHKLEVGGYLILDDWLISGARQALLDFRERIGIQEDLYEDFSGIFWKKTVMTELPGT
jgi:hypothetical protein